MTRQTRRNPVATLTDGSNSVKGSLNGAPSPLTLWKGTQAQRNVIVTPDPLTAYSIDNPRQPSVLTLSPATATPAINTDLYDSVTIPSLTTNITSMTTNLSGTPGNMQKLLFRIKDNGTPRVITWGASFQDGSVVKPNLTEADKTLLVGWIYDSVDGKWTCECTASRATAVVVPPAGSPLYVGDYSTNNFSQWPVVQIVGYNGSGSGFTPTTYSATIENDATYGKAARFEVRNGDIAIPPSGERSEVEGNVAQTGGNEGDVRWYKWATKFGTGFPTNHCDLASGDGWGVVNQWHCTSLSPSPSPPLSFGFRPWSINGSPWTRTPNGSWSLTYIKYNSGFATAFADAILHMPMNVGSWNEIKMQVCWSASDATGFVKIWLNNNPQTFLNGATTFAGRTIAPGDPGNYYKEGYYRNDALTFTGVVYHAAFKMAATEAALG